jgi:hypothetical protein
MKIHLWVDWLLDLGRTGQDKPPITVPVALALGPANDGAFPAEVGNARETGISSFFQTLPPIAGGSKKKN